MKIRSENYVGIVLEEVFNPVTLITDQKEKLYITMRDSGFEICYIDKEGGVYQTYELKNGVVKEMHSFKKKDHLQFL